MLINDVIGMLEELPRTLAAGWATWLFAGLLLSVWQRRDSRRLVVLGPATRQKSGVRPPPGVPTPARPVKSVPMSSGDAFGELEALLEPPTGSHRMPGEASPVLTEPSRSAPTVLAAPQSLP
jgi:hypothetical protein